MDAKLLSPSVLAFMGDAVYGFFVREKLSAVNRPSKDLHSLSVKYVNAASQAKAYTFIADMLSDDEMAVFKRGRNFHTSSSPKNFSKCDYHIATGLETLFGFLHLSGNDIRAKELFDKIWENLSVG